MARILHGDDMHRLDLATPADFAINSVTDVTIVSMAVPAVAGEELLVESTFLIHNNSTASRVYNISLDFDAQFAAEITTNGLGTNATGMHPFYLRGLLSIRSTSLSYAVCELEGNPGSSLASHANMTVSTTGNAAKVWGTTTTDVTGLVTVEFLIRSAAATATQTLLLHRFTVRRIRPLVP